MHLQLLGSKNFSSSNSLGAGELKHRVMMIYTSDSYCIEMIKMIENDEMDLCYAFFIISFIVSYCFISF